MGYGGLLGPLVDISMWLLYCRVGYILLSDSAQNMAEGKGAKRVMTGKISRLVTQRVGTRPPKLTADAERRRSAAEEGNSWPELYPGRCRLVR